ncbi:MAG: spermidine synthase [Gammaproteobacteria bacterium]|nr:spermidine synthase [Gammaproteobacteria bacterium]MBQ0838911.1 spermidine synthase [Gammaproteobacteria bacterium]
MTFIFEELDCQSSPLGDISLRRRSEPRLNNQIVFEVKLGDEFLMSSLFVEAEEQLSSLGLAALKSNGHQKDLQIIVGGLGLGYTAVEALKDSAVQRMRVIDIMQPVISWHQRGLLPVGDILATDPRSELVQGDFFKLATANEGGFDQQQPQDKVHAVLLDIDHSPSHWLNDANQSFYTQESLRRLGEKICSGGIFALWSNELPDAAFSDLLSSVFVNCQAHIVTFPNPYTGEESSNSVYVATKQ